MKQINKLAPIQLIVLMLILAPLAIDGWTYLHSLVAFVLLLVIGLLIVGPRLMR